jgi:hypothetical protein
MSKRTIILSNYPEQSSCFSTLESHYPKNQSGPLPHNALVYSRGILGAVQDNEEAHRVFSPSKLSEQNELSDKSFYVKSLNLSEKLPKINQSNQIWYLPQVVVLSNFPKLLKRAKENPQQFVEEMYQLQQEGSK